MNFFCELGVDTMKVESNRDHGKGKSVAVEAMMKESP